MTFPAVRELVADGEFAEDDDPVEQFEFGLQRMLDGVALLVEARAGSARASVPCYLLPARVASRRGRRAVR